MSKRSAATVITAATGRIVPSLVSSRVAPSTLANRLKFRPGDEQIRTGSLAADRLVGIGSDRFAAEQHVGVAKGRIGRA